jgi:hypothetical protein
VSRRSYPRYYLLYEGSDIKPKSCLLVQSDAQALEVQNVVDMANAMEDEEVHLTIKRTTRGVWKRMH